MAHLSTSSRVRMPQVIAQLRTSALLIPRQDSDSLQFESVKSFLVAAKFCEVATIGPPDSATVIWRKAVHVNEGVYGLEIWYNPEAPSYSRDMATGRGIRVCWYAFATNPSNRDEVTWDRTRHCKMIIAEMSAIFMIPTIQHAYQTTRLT